MIYESRFGGYEELITAWDVLKRIEKIGLRDVSLIRKTLSSPIKRLFTSTRELDFEIGKTFIESVQGWGEIKPPGTDNVVRVDFKRRK